MERKGTMQETAGKQVVDRLIRGNRQQKEKEPRVRKARVRAKVKDPVKVARKARKAKARKASARKARVAV